MTRKIYGFSTFTVLVGILTLIPYGTAHAMNSYCLKYPGITITHEVFWTQYEQTTFYITMMQTHAWGPGAPNGVTLFTNHPTTDTQPLVHSLVNWQPGQWGILGDAGQFAIISFDPLRIISNPQPSACAEDYSLP